MNCVSIKAGRRAAFTFLELIIAVAIAMAFLSGVYFTFIQIIRAHDDSEARAEALRNGRTALTSLSEEIKSINRLGSDYLLVGSSDELTNGDGKDNDQDGTIDEETVDGLNNDVDAVGGADLHSQIAGERERPEYVGEADLGDRNVDEDAKFGRDAIVFRIYPSVPTPELRVKTITYAIADFDGQANVLVRQTRIDRDGQPPLIGAAPIAFNVLGFDLLYWDPNNLPSRQYWVESWDSSLAGSFNPPQLPLPASIYVRLTLYADRNPLVLYQAGKPVDTLELETVINIEQTINDALYPRAVR